MIKTFRVFEKLQDDTNIVYLAGPTYRITPGASHTQVSWRFDAIKLLEAQGFTGTVCVPEWRDGIKPVDWTYSRQVDWETENLTKAKVILFWIPREMNLLPGFTTNIEFGEWMNSGKIVVGAPKDAERIRYIRERCSRYNIVWGDTLKSCVDNALDKLKELKGEISNVWFTADTHFGHQRTLELSLRPFSSVEKMDWTMVSRWNESVGENDIVYHLGDFGDPKYLKCLNGKQLMFLVGNYDKPNVVDEMLVDKRVSIIADNAEIKLNEHNIHLIHEPESGDGFDNFFLFGHIHKLQMVKPNGLNVGVDCHCFQPINQKTILFYRTAILNYYDKNVFMGQLGLIHSQFVNQV